MGGGGRLLGPDRSLDAKGWDGIGLGLEEDGYRTVNGWERKGLYLGPVRCVPILSCSSGRWPQHASDILILSFTCLIGR